MTNADSLGFIVTPSSASEIKVAAYKDKNDSSIIGKMVYIDQKVDDKTFRALGTVTDTVTNNSFLSNEATLSATAGTRNTMPSGADLKSYSIKVQAVYSSEDGGVTWKQAGSSLPISPDTRSEVYSLSEVEMNNIIQDQREDVIHVGTFRGLEGVPVPMVLNSFNTKRGATHSAIIGRSGTGKTGFGQTLLFTQMKNQGHAIIVIDPQGQWSNEVGFLFSLQKAAKNLGREVKVLRVSEDLKLPLNPTLLAHFMEETRLWNSLQRMGEENRFSLSQEVSKKIVSLLKSDRTLAPKELLVKTFADIANSRSIMGRIYARGGDQSENLRRLFCALSGLPFINKAGEEELFTQEDLDDTQETWDSLVRKFTPLINLFSSSNLSGGSRTSLYRALEGVLKVRGPGEIAPYVILDMSSDVRLNSRANYAASSGADSQDDLLEMRNLLDNQEIKAHIVSTILDEIKRRAEESFATEGGGLDTQIAFDEAWRYAPKSSDVPKNSAIKELTEKLAGFALDTRKYGIGWTYILQVPSGLNETIWKQLTYVYSGYGMVGSDRKMLTELMDDANQMKLYDQFSSPQSTNVYPFMVTGPVSPLIFTSAPVFLNVFNTVEDMLSNNKRWIDTLCDQNGLPRFSGNVNSISIDSISIRSANPTPARPRSSRFESVKSYGGVTTSKEIVVEEPPF